MKQFRVRAIGLGTGMALMLALFIALGALSQAQPQVPDELLELSNALNEQVELALQEASLAWTSPTFDDVRRTALRTINILGGETGSDFDEVVGNPGDGTGVLLHAITLNDALLDSPWEDFAVTTDFVIAFSGWALEHARNAINASTEAEARDEIRRAVGFLRAARGCRDDLPTSGGTLTILTIMQDTVSNVLGAFFQAEPSKDPHAQFVESH